MKAMKVSPEQLVGQKILEAYEQHEPYFALVIVTDAARVVVTMDSGLAPVDIDIEPHE